MFIKGLFAIREILFLLQETSQRETIFIFPTKPEVIVDQPQVLHGRKQQKRAIKTFRKGILLLDQYVLDQKRHERKRTVTKSPYLFRMIDICGYTNNLHISGESAITKTNNSPFQNFQFFCKYTTNFFRSSANRALDTVSVITNTSQARMVCRDLTNFSRSGQIFKRTADKIYPG